MLTDGGSRGSTPVPSADTANVPSGSSTIPSWSGRLSPGASDNDMALERVDPERLANPIERETVDAATLPRIGDPVELPAGVPRSEAGDAAERQTHHGRKPGQGADAELAGQRERGDVLGDLGTFNLRAHTKA